VGPPLPVQYRWTLCPPTSTNTPGAGVSISAALNPSGQRINRRALGKRNNTEVEVYDSVGVNEFASRTSGGAALECAVVQAVRLSVAVCRVRRWTGAACSAPCPSTRFDRMRVGTIRMLRMSRECDQVAIRGDSSDTSRSATSARL
jgi:hypothetical protein